MSFFDSLEQIHLGGISLATVISAFLLLIFCLLAKKIIRRVLTNIIEKSHMDKGLKSFFSGSVNLVTWVIVVLVVLDHLGIPVTSLVALVSVIGLALSLSVQSILENLFSGLTVLGTRPFNIGDFIDIGDISGTVKAIGLFYTVIGTADGKSVYLPNSSVTSANVVNYSTNPSRRIDLDVTASYDDPPEKVKTAILKAIENTPEILPEPAPFVGVSEYGSSSIKYSLYVWAPTANFRSVKFDLTEKLYYAFIEEGVTMTYDHLNVHITEKKTESGKQ